MRIFFVILFNEDVVEFKLVIFINVLVVCFRDKCGEEFISI